MTDQYEEEQLDTLKKWWKENRFFVIAGLVIGIAVVVGWYSWKSHKESQALAASVKFEQAATALEDGDIVAAQKAALTIQTEHDSSPYAADVNFLIAQTAVEKGNYKAATDALSWVVQHRAGTLLEGKARYHLGAVQYNEKAYEDALATLDVAKVGTFIGQTLELRGDIYVAMGKIEEAKAAYNKALVNEEATNNMDLVKTKLNDLSGS